MQSEGQEEEGGIEGREVSEAGGGGGQVGRGRGRARGLRC